MTDGEKGTRNLWAMDNKNTYNREHGRRGGEEEEEEEEEEWLSSKSTNFNPDGIS